VSSSSLTPTQARRNVFVSAATGFMGFAGFTVVMPFLPLYIGELGVTDVGEIAMWSGLTLGATPAITAISAPLWGRVGDRYGSKLLIVRSLVAFVLTKGAMAFVTAPWQLVALRGLLGVFAGYGALTMSMAAQSVPRDEMPRAIGMVQMGQRLGPAVGPVVGGLVAPVVGLRNAFLITAMFYLAALLLIVAFYREPRRYDTSAPARSLWSVFKELASTPGFLLALAVIFTLQTVDRSFGPILPLYVVELGISGDRVATVSGVLFSLVAISAAAGHRVAGTFAARAPARVLVATLALTTAGALALMLLMPSLWTLTPALVVASVGIGIAMTAGYSMAGAVLPADAHVTGFAIMTTAALVGLAFSPVLAGFVGASGLHVVFLVDIGLLLGLAAAVARKRRNGAKVPSVPNVTDVPTVLDVPDLPATVTNVPKAPDKAP
jgi:MFS transporter, DHA1 family, multidrug resistance protein